jgi:hypothetical protein
VGVRCVGVFGFNSYVSDSFDWGGSFLIGVVGNNYSLVNIPHPVDKVFAFCAVV